MDFALPYDGEISTAISDTEKLLASRPDNTHAEGKLTLARNLQVAKRAVKEAVKGARVAKDGRVWIS